MTFWIILRFFVPHGTVFECTVPEVDYILAKHFKYSPNLYWIELFDFPISTLCFLSVIMSIQILQLWGCDNLQDCDFHCFMRCCVLDQLDIPFANISTQTVINTVNGKHLSVLDVSGIKSDTEECTQVRESCYRTLIIFGLSLSESEDIFNTNTEDIYLDCSYQICRK